MNKNSKPKTPIPVFINKLLEMLEDKQANEFIKWGEDGDCFIIVKITGFTEHILPKYFKHQNISSFIRQLNMYGFTKTRSDDWQNIYVNEYFQKGNKNSLKKIQRKLPKNQSDKDFERVIEKQSLDKKQLDQLLEIKGKQTALQKKCQQLIRQNKKLMEDNFNLMKKYEEDEKNRRNIFIQIQQMAFMQIEQQSNSQNKGNLAIEGLQYTDKLKRKTQAGSEEEDQMEDLPDLHTPQQNQNKISAAQIFGQQEKFLSINDFCNIPEDSFSEGIFFQ